MINEVPEGMQEQVISALTQQLQQMAQQYQQQQQLQAMQNEAHQQVQMQMMRDNARNQAEMQAMSQRDLMEQGYRQEAFQGQGVV